MAKTPVSIVQEYCTKQQILPKYDLVINGVGTHDPFFKYRLTVNEVVTFGDGKSKKEAKHEAARSAITLLRLSDGGIQREESSCTDGAQSGGNVEDVPSPYEGAIKQNSIGVLATICSTSMLPEPQYYLIGEVGPPHAKIFTFECNIAKLKERASSRTKQQAKHLSAIKMLERLKSVVGAPILEAEKISAASVEEIEKSKEAEKNEKAKLCFIDCKAKNKKLNENFNLACKDYHLLDLKVLFNDSPFLKQIASYNKVMAENIGDPCELLINLFESGNRQIVFTFVRSEDNKCACFCEMESSPYFITCSNGPTEAVSKSKAAHLMLLFLKTFL